MQHNIRLFFRNDFEDFAEVCFKEFGDRVKYWITINEPWTYSTFGYATGLMPPNRCSKWLDPKCVHGDSGKEPYLVSHHLLLAHAATVKVYRKKYQVHHTTFTITVTFIFKIYS